MTSAVTETRSVVVEREIAHPAEKIWRALTEPNLIEEWLMKNDFKPVMDHKFNLRGDWGAVDCQVKEPISRPSMIPITYDHWAKRFISPCEMAPFDFAGCSASSRPKTQ